VEAPVGKKALLTFAVGRHRQLLEMSLPRMERFARRHGYDLVVGDGQNDEGRHSCWSKITFLQQQLADYECCFWLDADVLVLDGSQSVADLVPNYAVQALVPVWGPLCGEHPNCGVWFLKRSALPLLQELWELEVYIKHQWLEQAALLTLLGYMGLDTLRIRHVRHTKWMRLTHFLPRSWNSHPTDMQPQPRLLHCAGTLSFPQRLQMMRAYL
jgi:hypothetical protein